MPTRRNGGRIGKINLPTVNTASGIFSIDDVLENRTNGSGTWPIGARDGSIAALAADSAVAIKTINPSATDGLYWILVNGVAKQIYCDMTNDGGGWMLWHTFGSSAPFQSGYALMPNNTNATTMGTNGWLGNNIGAGYTNAGSWGLPCGSEGVLYTNTWGLTTPTAASITLLRASFEETHIGPYTYMETNGTVRAQDSSGGGATTATSVPINWTGTQPRLQFREQNSISKLYWVMAKGPA
jgi:hypothetical protein